VEPHGNGNANARRAMAFPFHADFDRWLGSDVHKSTSEAIAIDCPVTGEKRYAFPFS